MFNTRSWEFEKAPTVPLAATEWKNPNLLSVMIIRGKHFAKVLLIGTLGEIGSCLCLDKVRLCWSVLASR